MTKAKILFPGWRYGPKGEGPELFQTEDDVPKGWTRNHPANRTSTADPLDHDDDGKKGGSAKGSESTAAKGAAKRREASRAKD